MKKLIIFCFCLISSLFSFGQEINFGNKGYADTIYAEHSLKVDTRYQLIDGWTYQSTTVMDSAAIVDGDTGIFIAAPGSGYHIIINELEFIVNYDGGAYSSSTNDSLDINTYNNNGDLVRNYVVLPNTLTSIYDDKSNINGVNSSIGDNKPYWYDIPDDLSAPGSVGEFILKAIYTIKLNEY